MANVSEHYDDVLADVYTWFIGGIDVAIEKNHLFFVKHNISPKHSGLALDLGAGSGAQSIPLAQLGFSVTAIDLSKPLLNELKKHASTLDISVINDDLGNLMAHCPAPVEIVTCMTDTLTHLESKNNVQTLFKNIFACLENEGQLVLSFRELTGTLNDLDRFIPLKLNDSKIMTCFLEYEKNTVKVHDLLYTNVDGAWQLNKSFYRKLRLSKEWVETQLTEIGYKLILSQDDNGFVSIIGKKPSA